MDTMTYYKKYEPIFGSWHITKMLGEGSFGKVFEIERQDFGETYRAALKVISVPQNESEVKNVMASGMDSSDVTEYFESVVKETVSEIVQMSKLKGNSYIVSYEDHQVIAHDDKRIGWDILIRMELLTPLLDYTQNSDSELIRKDVMKLGIDMCHALELCQKQNIIHRDIKPGNIFVSGSGNYKLGDFGIARTIEKTSGELSKKGTHAYMAPEVYKGEEYGSDVDIYSLGIVLYRLLNKNRTPFLPPHPEKIKYSDTDRALVRRISGEALPMPVGAGGRLAEIVLKACSYNPKDRYSSPMQMRAELEAILYEADESKIIYPKGDNVEVAPNEYVTSDEENDGNFSFEDEGTVSVFGSATRSTVSNQEFVRLCEKCGAKLQSNSLFCTSCKCLNCGAAIQSGNDWCVDCHEKINQNTSPPVEAFCMNCRASIPTAARFCMGCGASAEQDNEFIAQKSSAKNVAATSSEEYDDEVLRYLEREELDVSVLRPHEVWAKNNIQFGAGEHIVFQLNGGIGWSVYWLFTITNQRIIVTPYDLSWKGQWVRDTKRAEFFVRFDTISEVCFYKSFLAKGIEIITSDNNKFKFELDKPQEIIDAIIRYIQRSSQK